MAINMLNEDGIVRCPNCGSNLLLFNQVYILDKVNTKEGTKYKKVPYKSNWTCVECNTDIPIKEKDILNT